MWEVAAVTLGERALVALLNWREQKRLNKANIRAQGNLKAQWKRCRVCGTKKRKGNPVVPRMYHHGDYIVMEPMCQSCWTYLQALEGDMAQ